MRGTKFSSPYARERRKKIIRRRMFIVAGAVLAVAIGTFLRFIVFGERNTPAPISSSVSSGGDSANTGSSAGSTSSVTGSSENPSSESGASSDQSSAAVSSQNVSSAPTETSDIPSSTPPISSKPASPTGGGGSTEWSMVLVNKTHALPEGFEPALSAINGGDYSFDSRAVKYLENMIKDCKNAGLSPLICSAYRSINKQTQLFNDRVAMNKAKGQSQEEAVAAAATIVAVPGTSEHNLGLAADIVATSYQILDDAQGDTAECKWLYENCHKYGFILRYPKNKQAITGIIYEPWHFRYVGVDVATEIMSQGICLEEYLGES
ncbi:MAG TPA: D-Ala-D-Ala carboxypeptidase VanY [Ruminococcaceae bacterium]|nr:D-Ala-D-Ala carboxypeptidase VanY [Oscillospiraceae bacterium]